MKKWTIYRSDLANDAFDAIIIGSGMGGLTTAALLALNGKRVLVLEKQTVEMTDLMKKLGVI